MKFLVFFGILTWSHLSLAMNCNKQIATQADLENLFPPQSISVSLNKFTVKLLEQKCLDNHCGAWVVSKDKVELLSRMKNSAPPYCRGCYVFEGPIDLNKIANLDEYEAIENYIQDYQHYSDVFSVTLSLSKRRSSQNISGTLHFADENSAQRISLNLIDLPLNQDSNSLRFYNHRLSQAPYTRIQKSGASGYYNSWTIDNSRFTEDQLHLPEHNHVLSLSRINIYSDGCAEIVSAPFRQETGNETVNYQLVFEKQ